MDMSDVSIVTQMNLPKEVTTIEEDLQSIYTDSHDCWLACALRRAGVSGFSVAGIGCVREKGSGVFQIYKWKNGDVFGCNTRKIGTLVLTCSTDISKHWQEFNLAQG